MRSNAPLSSDSLSETIFPSAAKGIVLHQGWKVPGRCLDATGKPRKLSARREGRFRGGAVKNIRGEVEEWREIFAWIYL